MKIFKTKCDECGKERDDNQFGGYPMISVDLLTGITRGTREKKDFCDESCLFNYLKKLLKK